MNAALQRGCLRSSVLGEEARDEVCGSIPSFKEGPATSKVPQGISAYVGAMSKVKLSRVSPASDKI